MDIYDIASNSWSTGAVGGNSRRESASAIYQDKIYYWAGFSAGGVYINSMDIYDITNNTWSVGVAGGTARAQAIGASYNGKLYFYGGYNSSGNLNSVDIYDISTNLWSTGTAGGLFRQSGSGDRYGDSLYVWGGYYWDGSLHWQDTVDIYNLTTNTWTTGSNSAVHRYSHSFKQYDGIFYAYAGDNDLFVLVNTLDIYDTGYHPNPEFQNLPGDTRTINLDEGQVITTTAYTLEVYPTSPNDIEKVEFFVDNQLIDTDYTADTNGVYSTIWDTTQYHSDVRIVAYDPFGRTTELTRSVIVGSSSNGSQVQTLTALPETGMREEP